MTYNVADTAYLTAGNEIERQWNQCTRQLQVNRLQPEDPPVTSISAPRRERPSGFYVETIKPNIFEKENKGSSSFIASFDFEWQNKGGIDE